MKARAPARLVLPVAMLGAIVAAAITPLGDGRAEGKRPPSPTAVFEIPAPATSTPGFAAPGGSDPARANAACGVCHVAIAAEHATSEHRTAFTDPTFQRALALEPFPFCRGCHATEADPATPPPAPLAALGVSCAACHGDPRAPLSAHPSPSAPHGITVDPTFSSDAPCKRCHEFQFPDRHRRPAPAFFQRTHAEHAASPFGGTSCSGCHMPPRDGHRAHAFASSRDPAAIARAVKIDARRVSADPPGRIAVTLASEGVGHAFPTGDLFRRVVVEAEIVGPEHASLGVRTVYLTRTFRDVPRGLGVVRTEIADTRLVAGKPSEVLLDLGPLASKHAVSVRVVYQRVAGGGPHPTAKVGSEVPLFSTLLAPPLPARRGRRARERDQKRTPFGPHQTPLAMGTP